MRHTHDGANGNKKYVNNYSFVSKKNGYIRKTNNVMYERALAIAKLTHRKRF